MDHFEWDVHVFGKDSQLKKTTSVCVAETPQARFDRCLDCLVSTVGAVEVQAVRPIDAELVCDEFRGRLRRGSIVDGTADRAVHQGQQKGPTAGKPGKALNLEWLGHPSDK
ncbi:hypothetical protein [Amycolatopsis sp. WAC 01375]|uniref:hypothetical protein n=1 Tax=Amycolatopsis sp. WAC 01375 TaxID=2203194 RepID=UPI001F26C1D1|nr:hypothetical protein [Amycolatopsis sp. WAC 01375]